MRTCLGAISVGFLVGFIVSASSAQAARFSVGGSFGLGHLPMSDWRKFGSMISPDYEADVVGLYGEAFGRLQLRDRHGLRVSVERITKSASGRSTLTVPPDFQVEWDFSAVPINVSYEYSVGGIVTRATTLFGVGAGVYRSRVKSSANSASFGSYSGKRVGWGYGLHSYVGQRVAVTPSMAISGQIRYRWADGMWFTDQEEDVDVDFTGVDLTLGLEFGF